MPEPGPAPVVAIIGAGPSGLAAARAMKEAGIPAVVFEKSDRIGGNWVWSPEPSHSSVAETTHVISSKRHSGYDGFPMPADYPDYPSHRQVLQYFEAFADRFGLRPMIRFGAPVVRAEPAGAGWRVETAAGEVHRFEHLLVANGHHWAPRMPSYPGTFAGELLHSHDYKRAAPFQDRRVLVIGGGNSACDIAVETSRISAATAISWRRGYHVVPKLMFGQPPDVLEARMRWIPGPIRRRLQWATWRVVTGGNARYGLPEPDHPFRACHPVVNSELLYFIRHGRIAPRPDVAAFEGSAVRFADGRVEPFDVVIAATGFRISVPFLSPEIADFGDGAVPLYRRIFHPRWPTLYFIGLIQPTGAIWPLAELQARLVAARIEGRYRLPADLAERAVRETERGRARYLATARHAIEVDYHDYRAELAGALRSLEA